MEAPFYAVLTLILIVILFVVFGGSDPVERAAEENRQHVNPPVGGAFAGGL